MKKLLVFFLAIAMCVPFALASVGCSQKQTTQKEEQEKQEEQEEQGGQEEQEETGTIINVGSRDGMYGINAAFDVANDGDTLMLMEDATLSTTIVSSKNLTLDLNGYLIDLNKFSIFNSGKLKVTNTNEDPQTHYFKYYKLTSSGYKDGGWYLIPNPDSGTKKIAVDASEVWDVGGNCVKITGSVICNGRSIFGSGGGIVNSVYNDRSGDLTIKNVTFVNCATTNGGAIANFATNLTIEDVTAYGCYSEASGGVIYNATTMTADNLTIYDCMASISGGAIVNLGTAELTNSNFRACKASEQGGMILNGVNAVDTSAKMTISNCTFKEGQVSQHGGTISNNNRITITDCGIYFSEAASGGAIFNTSVTYIFNSSIEDCEAFEYGGAIFSDGVLTNQNLNAATKMKNVTILECTAPNHSTWNESVYVRNSTLLVEECMIQNMIFTNDNTSEGHPECHVEILSGYFTYRPKDGHLYKSFVAEINENSTAPEDAQAYEMGFTYKVYR